MNRLSISRLLFALVVTVAGPVHAQANSQPAACEAVSEAAAKGSTVQVVSCELDVETASPDALLAGLNQLQRTGAAGVSWESGVNLSGRGEAAVGTLEAGLGVPGKRWRSLIGRIEARGLSGDLAPLFAAFSEAAARGAASDTQYRLSGTTDLSTFFRLCESERLACAGAWSEDAPIPLPPGGSPRLDQPQIVFTGSSANLWGTAGHYNRGLDTRADQIVVTEQRMMVPLRYRANVGSSESAGPAQPDSARFDLTLRRMGLMSRHAGKPIAWRLGKTGQEGSAVLGADGTLTIEGLSLDSGSGFVPLFLQAPKASWQLVYTRQPRARQPVPGTPVKEAANWQHATDVGRINGGIAEADVVIDDLNGRVKVIHNCTTSKEVCVAQEPRVSPDGTKIVYSVGYGNQLNEVIAQGLRMGIREIPGLTHAKLFVYDLTTGETAPIPNHPKGAIDRQPEWQSNERIVFASNRGNTYPPKNQFSMHRGNDQFDQGRCFNAPHCVSQEYGYGPHSKSMQIWSMNIDGTDARNLTPHEGNALAPAVMANGDILYSCWNAHENKSFDAWGRTANNPGTSKNKWWLCRMDANGADGTVILNGHKSLPLKTRDWLPRSTTGGEGRSELRAIRSVAEIFDDKLAVSNYYRANHVGSLGIIYTMDYTNPHVEGCSTAACYPHAERASRTPGSGHFVPSSIVAATPYGTDQDIDVRRDGRGRPLGKAGYAAPLPDTDTEYLVTHGRGSCYEGVLPEQANRRVQGGEPTCQKGIYRVKVPVVTDPFDTRQMEPMASDDRWQIYDGRAIATYQQLHGKPLPDQPEPPDPNGKCYLQVVDAREAELQPNQPYSWRKTLYSQCALQGCAVNTEDKNFHARNMKALTIYLPEMWDWNYGPGREKAYANNMNNMGHKSISLLGSQPLEADGSVKMQVPCETPLLMAGTDAQGMSIAHDAMLHSLRAGETRTCHGCHDGHSEERNRQLDGKAVERMKNTLAYTTFPPLPKARAPITFEKHVKPIIEKRCTSCHQDMNDRDGLLYDRITWDYEQFDWPWAKKQIGVGNRKAVEHVLVRRPGRNYKVGEVLQFQPGGAAGRIAAVGPQGGIQAIRLNGGGDNYKPLTAVKVQTVAGQGADLVAMTAAFELQRPYTSKWVARFARDSLLYWKCVGARRDGRKDQRYPDDIDFGPAHASGATEAECRTIGQWIDTGVQRQ